MTQVSDMYDRARQAEYECGLLRVEVNQLASRLEAAEQEHKKKVLDTLARHDEERVRWANDMQLLRERLAGVERNFHFAVAELGVSVEDFHKRYGMSAKLHQAQHVALFGLSGLQDWATKRATGQSEEAPNDEQAKNWQKGAVRRMFLPVINAVHATGAKPPSLGWHDHRPRYRAKRADELKVLERYTVWVIGSDGKEREEEREIIGINKEFRSKGGREAITVVKVYHKVAEGERGSHTNLFYPETLLWVRVK
ncbi:hypothetical protein KYLE_103 [Pantoea phage Kyle]|uniref:Uncharacterized protein n=1 Tax=Pantoea phage Kyle TaxID=2589665 RepID=A0A514A8Q2_9CAUD|nr:hypothetical protein HWC52_gp103 [Pantoea phage Kyle]QDH49651.1 hypothetical protein KYLE_103 [Pantoea phage Kyle]